MVTSIVETIGQKVLQVETDQRWRYFRFVAWWIASLTLVVVASSCKKDKETSVPMGTNFYASVKIREFPFSDISHKRPLLDLTDEEKNLIWSFAELPKDDELGLSSILHYLKVYSEKPDLYQSEIDRLLSILQKEEMGTEILGDPIFITSKFGIAPVTGRTKRSQESHRDQAIAELGLLGTPSSFKVEIGGKEYPLSEAVRECVANFYLEEKELAWSAIVLVLYLPPVKEWSNRFGEKCSFDKLVAELMERRFEDNSCAGAHLLESLTLIYEISLEEPILSSSVQLKLKKYLHQILAAVINNQDESGSWGLDWFVHLLGYKKPFKDRHVWTPSDDVESRLLATCHLVEWMLNFPDELDVPNETLQKAGIWMLEHLKTKIPGDYVPICPYGHVIQDLELLVK